MRDTFLRMLTNDEKNLLHLMLEDKESGYRAKIILLKDDGYAVPQIRKMTNHHDHNIRKWIHRFNEKGIDGIISKKHNHKQHKFDDDSREKDSRHSSIFKSKRQIMVWDSLHGHYVYWQAFLCMT